MKLSDYKMYPEVQCIYKITEINTNKNYIGSTFNLKERINRHRNYLKNNKHHSHKLQSAFNNNDIENFEVEIILDCSLLTIEELHKKEIEFIKKFNSVKNGFNCILNSKHYKKFKLTKESIDKFINSRSKPVIGINIKTNEKIYFNSISEAARVIKDQSTNISACCKGKRIRFVKGYVFVYKENFDKNKDYTKLNPIQYNRNPEILVERGKLNPLSKITYKYDLKGNLIDEYHSRSYCEKINNIPKEKLRQLIPKQTPFGGYIYTHNKK